VCGVCVWCGVSLCVCAPAGIAEKCGTELTDIIHEVNNVYRHLWALCVVR